MSGREGERKGSVGHYLPFSSPLGFPGGASGKEPTVREAGLILWLGRCPGGGHGNPLQYSCLENLMTEEPGGLHSVGSQRVRHD